MHTGKWDISSQFSCGRTRVLELLELGTIPEYSHKKKEIWAVKLRFLLIFQKNIATARTECTTKHENKASYNTDYLVPDLIEFFGNDWNEIKLTLKKEIFIYVKNIVLTKNWFVVRNFWELSKHHTENNVLAIFQNY